MRVKMSDDFKIRAKIVEDELQLLYIYNKADYENISEVFLKDILQRMK